MAGKWSNDQTAALIELYQGEPILYFVSNPDYHNKFKRQNALESITKGLQEVRANTTVNEIKAKINGLRARFNTELAKLRRKPSGSGSEVATVSFFFFEKLLFLQDHVAARASFVNIPKSKACSTLRLEEENFVYSEQPSPNWQDEIECSQEIQEEFDEDEAPVDVLSPIPSSSGFRSVGPASPAVSEQGPQKRKRTTSEGTDSFLQQAGSALNLLSKRNQPLIKDVWDEFGSFVASSLRNMQNDEKKILCKHEIMKSIMKYEEQNLL